MVCGRFITFAVTQEGTELLGIFATAEESRLACILEQDRGYDNGEV